MPDNKFAVVSIRCENYRTEEADYSVDTSALHLLTQLFTRQKVTIKDVSVLQKSTKILFKAHLDDCDKPKGRLTYKSKKMSDTEFQQINQERDNDKEKFVWQQAQKRAVYFLTEIKNLLNDDDYPIVEQKLIQTLVSAKDCPEAQFKIIRRLFQEPAQFAKDCAHFSMQQLIDAGQLHMPQTYQALVDIDFSTGSSETGKVGKGEIAIALVFDDIEIAPGEFYDLQSKSAGRIQVKFDDANSGKFRLAPIDPHKFKDISEQIIKDFALNNQQKELFKLSIKNQGLTAWHDLTAIVRSQMLQSEIDATATALDKFLIACFLSKGDVQHIIIANNSSIKYSKVDDIKYVSNSSGRLHGTFRQDLGISAKLRNAHEIR